MEIVEQHEFLRQRMMVRRYGRTEHSKGILAVPFRNIPQDLVVGTELFEDEEDMRNRGSGAGIFR